MRILFVSKCPPGFEKAWNRYGYETIIDKDGLCESSYKRIIGVVGELVNRKNVAKVFSFSFYPQISEACETLSIPYISWVTDSPHTQLLSKSVYNSVNRIITFDYVQYRMLCDIGVKNVWHMPIHVSSKAFDEIIKKDAGKLKSLYENDVSFMGSLYDEMPYNLYDHINYLPDFIRGYLEAAICAQRCVWGENLLHKVLNKDILDEIRKYVKLDINSSFVDGYYESFLEGIIHKKVAQLERKDACSELAKRFNFVLYTGSDTDYNPNIINKGKVDYFTEMPLMFKYSKININITLHSIESGIPLRVMDILACGGFCLTNYQAEIVEYFEDGKDLVVYNDFDDMYEKINYYLMHDSERMEIARKGRMKVLDLFNIDDGIGRILKDIEGDIF